MAERIKDVEIERGSGNVFADLGLLNPEERLFKAQLVRRIQQEIDARRLTQAEAGEVIGLDQADVSRLLRGRLGRFSAERLFEILNRLGCEVEVRVKRGRGTAGRLGRTRVASA